MNKIQNEKELDERLSERGLLRYAEDYFQSFEIITEAKPRILDLYQVKFYLLCHSIELIFKAYLRSKGYKYGQIKALGHDLKNIMNILKRDYQYRLDKKAEEMIIMLSKLYSTKQLEYFQKGYKELPPIKDFGVITKLILDATKIEIFNGTME